MRPEVRIEVVDQWSAFLAMGKEWNDLLAASPQRDTPMLAHEWFRAWWEAFGRDCQMRVLRLLAGERLIGLAPLMLARGRYYGVPVRLLSLITNAHSNRCDLILADEPDACRRAVLEYIRQQRRHWDIAELDFLPAEGGTTELLRASAGRFGLTRVEHPSHASPWIALDGDWEAFYRTRDGHFRRNLRNREKRLAALGPVTYEEAPPVLDAFMEELFVVGERSWKGDTQTAIGSTPEVRRFYGRLAELCQPAGMLSLHLLRVGGKPIAFHYSLRNARGLYLLKTEYDTEYRTYSPGHQIQRRVLERCVAQGLAEFDFLGPDMLWKRDWTDRIRAHVRVLLFHGGVRSRLLHVLEAQAKPLAKRILSFRRPSTHDAPAPHQGGD